jgi:hypothetical protein
MTPHWWHHDWVFIGFFILLMAITLLAVAWVLL